VLQGAPITTNDLDIVHQRTSANVARLLEVLLQLDATMRYDFAHRGLRPTAEMLSGRGQINLSTSWAERGHRRLAGHDLGEALLEGRAHP